MTNLFPVCLKQGLFVRVLRTMTDRYDLIIIGGGPAEMMAAGRAGERGKGCPA
ncbi:MAG: hypothetical protein HS132_18810 [Planctomycetia bacterium]|nr:hypothetical protein [Planctomycetia bacterium]